MLRRIFSAPCGLPGAVILFVSIAAPGLARAQGTSAGPSDPAPPAAGTGTTAENGSVEATTAPHLASAPAASSVEPPPAEAGTPVAPVAPVAAAAPEEVQVLGARLGRVAGSAHVVDEKQLARFGYTDPHQVLLQVPGVYVRGEDGFGLRPNIGIRGAASDRSKKIALMEDGVLVGPAPYTAPAAYYTPLVGRMRAVRVIKGPAAISYGPQTVGGAIDFLTTAIPGTRRGTLDVGVGQYGFNQQHLTYGASDQGFGFVIEGMRLASSGFKAIDGRDADTGFVRNEWMGKALYELASGGRTRHSFELKATYSDEDSRETYLGLTDADFRENPDRRYLASEKDRMQADRRALAFTHRVRSGASFEMVTTAYRHLVNRSWSKLNALRGADLAGVLANPGNARNRLFYSVITGAADASSDDETLLIGPNALAFVSQGIQTTLRLKATTGPVQHRLEYGYRFHYDSSDRRHSQSGFVVTEGALVSDGRAEQVTLDAFASTHAVSLHAADALTWRALTLTPGARVELIQSRFDDRTTGRRTSAAHALLLPGVGAFFAATPTFGFLAGVYRGFSPPPPGVSKKLVPPEDSINTEAGARYLGPWGRAELIGFYNAYRNLTDICTFSNGCTNADLDRQFAAGRARILGLEAFAERAIRVAPGAVVPVRFAYTYTHASFLNGFTSQDPIFGDVQPGDRLPYVPDHQLSASTGFERESVGGANLGVVYSSRMRERPGQLPLGDPQNLTTDASFSLDVSGHLRLWRALELYANVRNVTNNRTIVSRRPFGARPSPPRWAQVGLKASF
jgi:Fe(3+) dicitrate transport protein